MAEVAVLLASETDAVSYQPQLLLSSHGASACMQLHWQYAVGKC
jgi:hypothetical protein